MIIEFLRKKILQKQFFARQFWEHKNNKHKSNIFNEFNLEYKRFGSKNPNVAIFLPAGKSIETNFFGGG